MAIKALGGVAQPAKMGELMGCSQDYADQICDDLVRKKYLAKEGLKYRLVADWDGLEEDAKVLRDEGRGRFTLGTYAARAEAPGAVEARVSHPSSITRVRTIRDAAPPADDSTVPPEQEQREREKKAREALEKFTPMALDY